MLVVLMELIGVAVFSWGQASSGEVSKMLVSSLQTNKVADGFQFAAVVRRAGFFFSLMYLLKQIICR